MRFALDCSVTMTWFFDHDASVETDRLLGRLAGPDAAVVPQHWWLEVTNVLLAAEASRKKRAAESAEFLALLGHLAIESDAETEAFAKTTTIALGRKHKLTSYDAAYLELAMRRGVALATLDQALRKAALSEGVPVFPAEPARSRKPADSRAASREAEY
jgi:predicted nucleic acid-binding protein